MGNAGHDGLYFQRELHGAIKRRDLNRIRMCVPTVEHLSLASKARILDVVLEQRQDLYDRPPAGSSATTSPSASPVSARSTSSSTSSTRCGSPSTGCSN